MKFNQYRSSWIAFILFYLVLIAIVTLLDWYYNIFSWAYWGTQVGLITIGVGIFAVVGIFLPDLSAMRGVLLAFTVGILTIIPAVLMGLGDVPGLWPQYFYIAFGMAAGSFLSFLFIKITRKLPREDKFEQESERVD